MGSVGVVCPVENYCNPLFLFAHTEAVSNLHPCIPSSYLFFCLKFRTMKFKPHGTGLVPIVRSLRDSRSRGALQASLQEEGRAALRTRAVFEQFPHEKGTTVGGACVRPTVKATAVLARFVRFEHFTERCHACERMVDFTRLHTARDAIVRHPIIA